MRGASGDVDAPRGYATRAALRHEIRPDVLASHAGAQELVDGTRRLDLRAEFAADDGFHDGTMDDTRNDASYAAGEPDAPAEL